MTTNALRRHKRLLGPATDAKLYQLPERVQVAVDAVLALAEVQIPPPELTPGAAQRELVAAMLENPKHAGTADTAGLEAAHAADPAHTARHQALQAAREVADQQLSAAVHDGADELLAAVRTAGEQVWKRITVAAAKLGDIDIANPDAMMRAGDDARAAWLELGETAPTYHRLRSALVEIPWDGEQTEWDHRGDHREFAAGLCTLLGPSWYGTPMSDGAPRKPWDEADPTGRSRVVWLVRAAAVPHWVSPAEVDRCWQAAHQTQFQGAREQQHRQWQATTR